MEFDYTPRSPRRRGNSDTLMRLRARDNPGARHWPYAFTQRLARGYTLRAFAEYTRSFSAPVSFESSTYRRVLS
jgi:hypothetical protein